MVWKLSTAMAQVRPLGIRVFLSQMGVLGVTAYLVARWQMGAVGAGLASFAVGAAACVLLIWPLALRLADVKFGAWVRETLFLGLMPTCVGGVVWMMLRIAAAPRSWRAVGLCVAVGWLFYVATLLRFSLTPVDRSDLMVILAKAGPLSRLGCLVGGEARRGG